MAVLPSNTFICNYNARDFDGNRTIPKTTGQLFDEDLYLTNSISNYSESSITLSGQYFSKTFANNASNPFNRTSTDSLTIVAKLVQGADTSGAHSVLSNRNGNNYNWMVFNPGNGSPVGMFFLHHSLGAYADCPYIQVVNTSVPNIFSFRVSGGTGFGQSYTDEQTFRSTGVTWGNQSTRVGFFCGGQDNNELWKGTFYWIYVSQEYLTDEQIRQVISYNEGNELSIDPDTINFDATGGTNTVDVSSENPWTASTTDNWISISPLTGSSDATVTISTNYNNSNNRTGTVTFTDGEDTIDLTVNQKADTTVILKNIYRNGNKVPEMWRNGIKIYKMVTKPVFIVDTDSITFDNTGGTYTINITANDDWTMTIPNFVTASSLSGKSNSSIIISTNSVPENKLEGNIIITMGNKSQTIAVTQQGNVHYVSYIHISSMAWNLNNNINTGIYASTDTEIRVKYMGKGYNVDRIAGFAPNEGATDSTDFRLFYYQNGALDVMNQRTTNLVSGGIMVNNTVYDFTFGNNFVYDNLTETEIYRGTTQSSMNTSAPIRVDVGGIWLNRIQIKKGGVVVFDGKAVEENGIIGLYDEVSQQIVYNPSLTMSYEE